jgi:tetratricopeptide (TPR) repeat protein
MLGAQLATPAFLAVSAPDPSLQSRPEPYRPPPASPKLDLNAAKSTADSGEPVWAGKPMGARLPSAPASASWKIPTAPVDDETAQMERSSKRVPVRGGGAATDQVRFGNVRPASDTFDPDAVLDEIGARRSRAPHLIAGLILAGGAAFAVWWFGFRDNGKVAQNSPQDAAAVAAPTVTPMTGDAAPAAVNVQPLPPASAPAPAADKPYKDAIAKLYEDTDDSLVAADKLLEGAHVADPAADGKVLAAQALIAASRAQAFTDDAEVTQDPRVAAEARAEAARQLTRAEKLAKDALAKAPNAPEALIAAADVARQKKVPTAEIEKQLAAAGDRADALYERGMLRWRDGKTAEAEALFTRAVDAQSREMPGTTHLRARYRLATLSLAAKHYDLAKAQLDAILAAQPVHKRAQALAAKVASAQTAAPSVPAQPPAPQPPGPSPVPGQPPAQTPAGKPGEGPSGGPVASADYQGQVAKANKLAETGKCTEAIQIYEHALDARPSGVEALTGLGYCFLDKKDFPQALSSFRAALGISPRYPEALLGMGDTYKNEGMKSEAVEYYKRYLDIDPHGQRSTKARQYVEEFEGTHGEPAEETPPPQPKPERPTPAPEPKHEVQLPPDKLPDKPADPVDPPTPEVP